MSSEAKPTATSRDKLLYVVRVYLILFACPPHSHNTTVVQSSMWTIERIQYGSPEWIKTNLVHILWKKL